MLENQVSNQLKASNSNKSLNEVSKAKEDAAKEIEAVVKEKQALQEELDELKAEQTSSFMQKNATITGLKYQLTQL